MREFTVEITAKVSPIEFIVKAETAEEAKKIIQKMINSKARNLGWQMVPTELSDRVREDAGGAVSWGKTVISVWEL